MIQPMYVFSNLAISIDGKIGVAGRSHFYLGTAEDRKRMLLLRRDVDAIIMGASTIRAFQKPCLAKDSEKHPMNVILSRALDGMDPEWSFFKSDKINRVLFYSQDPDKKILDALTPSSTLIRLKNDEPTATQILRHLENMGCVQVIVEGGGSVMWDFASQNLIDEYRVTLTPKIVGGTEAPTLVDGKGFSAQDVLSLKLTHHEVVEDEIFLTYKKK